MTHCYGGLVGPVLPASRIARSRNPPEMYEILSWQECLMKLRHNEYCPIHRSLSCCGRERTHRARSRQPSVRRVEDPHHPRGYRALRSPAEMRKLLKRKVREQNGICAICHHEFIDYNDIVPDHRDPKGMGALGEMIIRTIFKQHIGGAMGERIKQNG